MCCLRLLASVIARVLLCDLQYCSDRNLCTRLLAQYIRARLQSARATLFCMRHLVDRGGHALALCNATTAVAMPQASHDQAHHTCSCVVKRCCSACGVLLSISDNCVREKVRNLLGSFVHIPKPRTPGDGALDGRADASCVLVQFTGLTAVWQQECDLHT